MAIVVQNRQRTRRIQTARIKKDLQRAMVYLACQDKELSVVFGTDRLLQELNRTYRLKDYPTNVLAFPQPPVPGAESAMTLLGDVVVSLPTAAREAEALAQPLEARVLYLLIHGLLHLLGYDHEGSAAARRRMAAREREILTYLQTQS